MRVIRPIFAAIVLVIVIVAVNQGRVLDLIPSDCTVGLSGAAVSIEANGSNATQSCTDMSAMVTDGGNWYVYRAGAQPGGAVICQRSFRGITFTVRDQGALNVYGSSACSWLNGLAGPP